MVAATSSRSEEEMELDEIEVILEQAFEDDSSIRGADDADGFETRRAKRRKVVVKLNELCQVRKKGKK